jgi:quercetin dioxygenase-like cupin family protein
MSIGPLARPTRSTAAVYALADGRHVTVLVDASETGGAFDLVEVAAGPGGVSPPHRHGFAEWFHVVDGTLSLTVEHDEEATAAVLVEAGATYVLPPRVTHAVANPTERTIRFIVAGFPAVTSSFVAKAGVRVRDAQTPPTVPLPDRASLSVLAGNFGIDFRTGMNP